MANLTDQNSAYYLQQATKELASDLTKLREAPDFKSDSVDLLVHTIRQGSFSLPAKPPKGNQPLASDLKSGRSSEKSSPQ
ncbi:hypothetical protein jhhlp_002632 [Lomentospora prolificans]|uniref:Ribosome-assembly protein 3 C-terminal domain-containing protein n=1 Tax=Lomentospora prolificans TaxID=41688 RepID=A0A2N3NEL4_9PEZI|nr:hypothetical protein jhhlp_002632 [Lomentospora prolificans]